VYLRFRPGDESGHSSSVRFDRFRMTTFLLIRHAHCDPLGQAIAGRAEGVHLNARGRREALALGQRLSPLELAAVYSSPLERAVETATPISESQGLPIEPAPGMIEVDFGEWTGRSLAELDGLPQWKAFNSFRSGTRIPGGECAAEVLARALAELQRIGREHPDAQELVAIVSHADVLRAVIAHFLGIPTDLYHRIELSPASVSVLALEPWGSRLLLLNSTDGWPGVLPTRETR
jgi:broad specificity phosphatase PhoE